MKLLPTKPKQMGPETLIWNLGFQFINPPRYDLKFDPGALGTLVPWALHTFGDEYQRVMRVIELGVSKDYIGKSV